MEPMPCSQRSYSNKKPARSNRGAALLATTTESRHSDEDPVQPKISKSMKLPKNAYDKKYIKRRLREVVTEPVIMWLVWERPARELCWPHLQRALRRGQQPIDRQLLQGPGPVMVSRSRVFALLFGLLGTPSLDLEGLFLPTWSVGYRVCHVLGSTLPQQLL